MEAAPTTQERRGQRALARGCYGEEPPSGSLSPSTHPAEKQAQWIEAEGASQFSSSFLCLFLETKSLLAILELAI